MKEQSKIQSSCSSEKGGSVAIAHPRASRFLARLCVYSYLEFCLHSGPGLECTVN